MILYIANRPFCRAKKIRRKNRAARKNTHARRKRNPRGRAGRLGCVKQQPKCIFCGTRAFSAAKQPPPAAVGRHKLRGPVCDRAYIGACMRVAVPPYPRLYTRPPRARVHARERAHGRGQVRACAPASSCCGGASVTGTRATLPVMATGAFKRRLGIAACTRADFSRRP